MVAFKPVMVCVINSALANSLGGFQYHMLPWVRTLAEVCVGGVEVGTQQIFPMIFE